MIQPGGAPLAEIRVVEMAGIGPVPFCGMLLADLGADVIRIDRTHAGTPAIPDQYSGVPSRGRRSVAVDLKLMQGRAVAERIIASADVLIEGMRPGKMEVLALGPEDCLELNPRLIYGRMTGWGQQGPYSSMAGHDINYIGLVGALDAVGEPGSRPVPPLNLVGDYGGGALYLTLGILAALVERERSGAGQVVDAAMIDGAASLMTTFYELMDTGLWTEQRGANLLDGGAPFYRTYATADGRYMAVGALEPMFFRALILGLGLSGEPLPEQYDGAAWPLLTERIAVAFKTRTQSEWQAVFDGTDACVTPVLSMREAAVHPHNIARRTFVERNGAPTPGPAPRFSRSRMVPGRGGHGPGTHTDEVLYELGYSESELADLRFSQSIA